MIRNGTTSSRTCTRWVAFLKQVRGSYRSRYRWLLKKRPLALIACLLSGLPSIIDRQDKNVRALACKPARTSSFHDDQERLDIHGLVCIEKFRLPEALFGLQFYDNRASKPTPRHPDFKHKETRRAMWLDSAPTWVHEELSKTTAPL